MRTRLAMREWRALPRSVPDVLRQLCVFAAAYGAYELVRGLARDGGRRPFADATRVIDFERSLHVFVEPRVQAWVTIHAHWLLDLAVWAYLNAHFTLSVAVLAFIYLRRNESFYFVRNTLAIAMALALVGYLAFPTAPPRLMPAWGFTDPLARLTGVSPAHGLAATLFNPYAAIPSMHVCVALIIGGSMSRLVSHRLARVAWLLYPALIVFVVVATGNHYLTDVVLGAATAAVSAVLAKRLLARARPDVWAFQGLPTLDPLT